MSPLAAVEETVAGTVAALGPVLGTVVVLTGGVAVGAALGGVLGVGYRWVGQEAEEESADLGGDDLPGDLTLGRLVAAVALVGAIAVGGSATTSAFAAVIRRAVAAFGPVVGGLVVVGGGVGVGAVLGTVVGVGYLWWSGSSLGGGSSTGPESTATERPGATTPADDPVSDASGGDGLVPDVPTEMPRRQVLGTVAAVGGAAALGGLGTSAFYADEERFANNQVVTGELDLKVDWQEHYSDWSDDEVDRLEFDMTDSSVGPGFPSAAPEDEKLVYVSDPDQFLENTAIEAFPDIQPGESGGYDALQVELGDDSDICDLDADLDDALSSDLRTDGTFPEGVPEDDGVNPQTTEPGDPLVDIEDVKPGDFGEVTFSLHVCGNPGYVWLTGALRENAENVRTEPERDAGDTSDEGELADAIQAAVWYDTGEDGSYGVDFGDKDDSEGDNFRQDEERLLFSGSLREVLDAVSTGPGLPLDGDPGSGAGASGETGGGGGTGGDAPTVGGEVGLGTYVGDVFDTRNDDRFDGAARNYDCEDYEERIEGLNDLDGQSLEEAALGDGTQFSPCQGVTVTVDEIGGGTITLSSVGAVRVVSVKGSNQGEQVYVFSEPVVLDEAAFSTPDGSGISNIDVCCPEDGGDGGNGGGGGGQGDPGRQCFENSTTGYVGFEWWVPREVGSEIQTDSLSFDLGFYTEQCRHNDGSGFGTPGGGPDNGDGDDGDGGNGDGDTEGISFLAACVADDRSDVADSVDLEASVVSGSDPTEVSWNTNVPVDAIVAFQGARFTTYRFNESQVAGVVEVGADEDGKFVEVEDESPQTTIWKGKPEDRTETDQTPDKYCPPGYVKGDKIEF